MPPVGSQNLLNSVLPDFSPAKVIKLDEPRDEDQPVLEALHCDAPQVAAAPAASVASSSSTTNFSAMDPDNQDRPESQGGGGAPVSLGVAEVPMGQPLSANASRKNEKSKIYVGGLGGADKPVAEEEVKQLFSQFGEIVSLTHLGMFAFVELSSFVDADDAVSALDGTVHFGRCLRVQHAKAKHPQKVTLEKSSFDHCYSCGRPGHWANDCPNPIGRDTCFVCRKVGHISRNCPDARHSSYITRQHSFKPQRSEGSDNLQDLPPSSRSLSYRRSRPRSPRERSRSRNSHINREPPSRYRSYHRRSLSPPPLRHHSPHYLPPTSDRSCSPRRSPDQKYYSSVSNSFPRRLFPVRHRSSHSHYESDVIDFSAVNYRDHGFSGGYYDNGYQRRRDPCDLSPRPMSPRRAASPRHLAFSPPRRAMSPYRRAISPLPDHSDTRMQLRYTSPPRQVDLPPVAFYNRQIRFHSPLRPSPPREAQHSYTYSYEPASQPYYRRCSPPLRTYLSSTSEFYARGRGNTSPRPPQYVQPSTSYQRR